MILQGVEGLDQIPKIADRHILSFSSGTTRQIGEEAHGEFAGVQF
jgi:hypothetical protein